MNYPGNNPEHWRAKAEEARTVADNMREPKAAEHMRSVAETYDALAAIASRGPLFSTPNTAGKAKGSGV